VQALRAPKDEKGRNMADKIPFELVSPERLLLAETADMVTLPGTDGYFGVLYGHMPLITTLKPGVIDVSGGDLGDRKFFVLGGFAEVSPAKVTVLAEEAMPMADVDAVGLDSRIKDAEEDVMLAKTETDRARAVDTVDALRTMRAAI
jgi:F-type H+-transporting ATPase subunit epsilon